MKRIQQIAFAMLAASMLLGGCVSFNTLPVAARAGDTITVAIGSADGANKSNTTAKYYPDSGGEVTIPVKSVFNLYGDKKTRAVANNNQPYWNVLETSGHEPWLTLLVADLPATGLPVGTGHLIVDTPATYPTAGVHVNQVPIELEILPGTGSPHPLSYQIGLTPTTGTIGNLATIEPAHHVTVKPDYDENLVYPTYGAIELTLKFTADGAPPADYQVISDDVSLYTGSDRNILHKVSGDELTVMYVSANGLLTYYEPRFSVIPLPAKALSTPPPGTMPSAPPTVSAVKFYDIDGNPTTNGPLATDYKVVME